MTAVLAAFIAKIVGGVLKKCVATAAIKYLASAFQIYSTFETLVSIHDCRELDVCRLELGYETVSSEVAQRLVNEISCETFDVQQKPSGLYVASPRVAAPGLWLPTAKDWKAFDFDFEYGFEFSRKFTFDFEFRRQF